MYKDKGFSRGAAPATAPSRVRALVVEALFFAGYFLYVWLWVDPVLLYQNAGPVFFTGTDFLEGFLSCPGGLVNYASAFLLQCCQLGWLGAAIASVMAWLICGATRVLLGRIAGRPVKAAHLIPALLLLVIHNRYDSPVMSISIGLALATGLAAGYVLLPFLSTWLRAATSCVALVGLCYVAGPGPALLFAVLSGMFELMRCRRWLAGSICFLAGAALAVAVAHITGTMPGNALASWQDRHSLAATLAAYLYIPLAAAILAALGGAPAAGRPDMAKASWRTKCLACCRSTRVQWTFLACALLAAAVFLHRSFDRNRKTLLQVECLARQQQWQPLLEVAATLSEQTASARLHTLRALYHTGHLADGMFAFPQREGQELLPEIDEGLDFCMALSATFLELGQVNMAEHYAHESLEHDGDRPETLELLATVNVLKGRTQAARIFLNLLKKSPFHRRRAEQFLRALDADPRMSEDKEIARIRSVMVTTDFAGSHAPTASLLQQLLHTNKGNKMAFEYLMAHFLLAQQLDKFAKNLERMDGLDYPAIPRHYEEAILIYQRPKPPPPVDLHGRTIRAETLQRFAKFDEIARRHLRDLPSIQPSLAREYGDTFWFFALYGYTPGREAVRALEGKP
ncbi:MAG: DUF6057 family protein [Planctomycetota bacterium]|nr:DUF6057 family protein [Planctomycetota bacterium]